MFANFKTKYCNIRMAVKKIEVCGNSARPRAISIVVTSSLQSVSTIFRSFLAHVQMEFIVSTAVNRDVLNVKVSSDADKRILKVFKAITSQRASPVHKT
jgi:hypothetical protein